MLFGDSANEHPSSSCAPGRCAFERLSSTSEVFQERKHCCCRGNSLKVKDVLLLFLSSAYASFNAASTLHRSKPKRLILPLNRFFLDFWVPS